MIGCVCARMLCALVAVLVSLSACGKAAAAGADGKVIDDMITAGEKAYGAGNYTKAIELFMESKEMADKTGHHKYRCLAAYDIGVCYFNISENGEALKNFYDAYTICKDHGLGWSVESRILNGIAGVYFEESNFREARKLAYKCFRGAVAKRDSELVCTYALDMALIANKEKKFAESAKYVGITRRYVDGDAQMLSRILAVEAEAMFLQKKYDRVIGIAGSLMSNEQAGIGDKGIVLIYLINIYRELGQPDKAVECIGMAEQFVGLKNKPYLFTSAAELYKSLGDYRQALSCMDSVVVYSDSLTTVTNRQLAENSRIKMEVLKLKADMDKRLDRMKQRHAVTLLVVCILVLIVAIAVIMIRNQRIRNRNEHKMMELQLATEQHEKKLAEEQANAVEMEARYRQEIMRRELKQKQNELAATTMFISSRNELIEDLLKHLNGITETQGSPELKALVQHLKQMLKASNEHDSFIVNFESANPDFIKRLKQAHPELSASDIRFLAYIRMNLSMKDIASLTNINPESCKRRKIRISRKLGIGSSADLYDYIMGI